jgi:fused signal recognition particle receptor
VILVVGVNGVGKTTSIGKLAHYFSDQGKTVMVAAGDTFRAAAAEQLSVWASRAKVEIFVSDKTKDPAAVAFEGVQRAVAQGTDILIVDTAGRLHNQEHLMEELRKIKRSLNKALPGAPHETLLVVDANSGQNAVVQARQFHSALELTSLIVTKFDGTARGGTVVAIASELGLSPQFVGLGEKVGDLKKFEPEAFARELLM